MTRGHPSADGTSGPGVRQPWSRRIPIPARPGVSGRSADPHRLGNRPFPRLPRPQRCLRSARAASCSVLPGRRSPSPAPREWAPELPMRVQAHAQQIVQLGQSRSQGIAGKRRLRCWRRSRLRRRRGFGADPDAGIAPNRLFDPVRVKEDPGEGVGTLRAGNGDRIREALVSEQREGDGLALDLHRGIEQVGALVAEPRRQRFHDLAEWAVVADGDSSPQAGRPGGPTAQRTTVRRCATSRPQEQDVIALRSPRLLRQPPTFSSPSSVSFRYRPPLPGVSDQPAK